MKYVIMLALALTSSLATADNVGDTTTVRSTSQDKMCFTLRMQQERPKDWYCQLDPEIGTVVMSSTKGERKMYEYSTQDQHIIARREY